MAAGILLVALRRIAGPLRVTIDWSVVRRLAARAWHLVASALLGIAIYTAGILLLRAFQGAAAAGYYAAAYTLVTFAINVGAMYNLSLLPSLTSLAGSRDRQLALYHTSMAHLAGVGLPAAVGGGLLAGPIVELVFGAGYREAALPLALLLWSLPLNFVRDVPLMALISGGNERVVFRITLAAAILSVALGLALVPTYGILGAALGTLISELVRMGLALILARRHGFPLPPLGRFHRTGIAAVLMGLLLYAVKPGSVWVAVPLGAVCYLVGLLLTGGLRVRWGQLPELRV
ncbi:MAG: polysaccharide biosynthesis C-terminal domain-containing protein [Gemmatimonadales bacterium]